MKTEVRYADLPDGMRGLAIKEPHKPRRGDYYFVDDAGMERIAEVVGEVDGEHLCRIWPSE